MERKLVTIRTIAKIIPIEGADNIELAQVDGWQCVVKKGEFKEGDKGIYHEIDSLLPLIPLYDFLKKGGTKKMMVDGKEVEGYRLKTIRLRGKLSQGLLLPLASISEVIGADAVTKRDGEQVDLAPLLGIIKYEAPIPAQLSGQVEGMFPSFIKKTDQERCQNLTEELMRFQGMQFEVTEKLDGSSMTVYINDGHFGVCSRNLELKETEGNTMWRLARELKLEEKLKERLEREAKSYALQGEVIGQGIQKNPYKLTNQQFRIFDVFDLSTNRLLMPVEREKLLKELGLSDNHVPIIQVCMNLYGGSKELVEMAEGKSTLADVEREGIVFKSHFLVNGMPVSFKAISNNFLLSEE